MRLEYRVSYSSDPACFLLPLQGTARWSGPPVRQGLIGLFAAHGGSEGDRGPTVMPPKTTDGAQAVSEAAPGGGSGRPTDASAAAAANTSSSSEPTQNKAKGAKGAKGKKGSTVGKDLILGGYNLPSHVKDSGSKSGSVGYVEGLERSQYCFASRGDTQTSAHLFNAIAAGCVPIIVGLGVAPPLRTHPHLRP